MRKLSDIKGYTLVEMLVVLVVGMICMLLVFSMILMGTKLLARNFSVNFSHINVTLPMQRLTDDIHMAIATPQLTGTLATGAKGVVPGMYGSGGTGSTKSWTVGKMTPGSYSLPVVTGSGPASGMQVYLVVSSTYGVTDSSGTFNGSKAGFAVANGSYTASATSINLEVNDSAGQTLLTSASNGMHLCIPSAPVFISGSNYAMLDKVISSVSFNGSLNTGGTASTLVANCTLSGTLGVAVQTNGTRANSSAPVVIAYLVAPVNYFVCGTDLVRLNYDGNWEIVMRSVLPTDKTWAQAKPFSMPWPYNLSFLSSSSDGRRAVSVRLVASNPNFTTTGTASSTVNNRFRGANGDMLLYDIVIWSRMSLFDELVR